MDGPVEDRAPVPQFPRADSRSAADEELHRRLAGYQLSDRLLREKYGMTLEQFEAAQVVKQHGYSFEVENDHQDWDQAVDGIRSIERQLAALRGETTIEQLSPEHQEMLVNISRSSQIEARRQEIAADARASIAAFRAGKLKAYSAEELIAELHQSLEGTE